MGEEDGQAPVKCEEPKPSGGRMTRKSTERKVGSSFFAAEEASTSSKMGSHRAPEVDSVSGEVRYLLFGLQFIMQK